MVSATCVIMRHRKRSLFRSGWTAALALTVAACSTSADTGTAAPTRQGLTLTIAEPEHVEGAFVDGTVGLTFELYKDDVEAFIALHDLDGTEIYYTRTTYDDSQLRIPIGDLDMTVTAEAALRMTGDELAGVPLDHARSGQVSGVRLSGDLDAFARLQTTPEGLLIPLLSRALGIDAGLTGHEYPATLGLHMLAMRIAEEAGLDVVAGMSVDTEYYHPHCHYQNSYYGRCGAGSSCWGWVCGTCNQTQGCASHDHTCHRCASGENYLECYTCWTPLGSLVSAGWGGGCRRGERLFQSCRHKYQCG